MVISFQLKILLFLFNKGRNEVDTNLTSYMHDCECVSGVYLYHLFYVFSPFCTLSGFN